MRSASKKHAHGKYSLLSHSTLKGVHQDTPICLSVLHILARWKCSELEQKNETSSRKKTVADVPPVSLLPGVFFVLYGQCDTGVLKYYPLSIQIDQRHDTDQSSCLAPYAPLHSAGHESRNALNHSPRRHSLWHYRPRRVVLGTTADIRIPSMVGVVHPFSAGRMASGEVGDADDVWRSAPLAVTLLALITVVYAQQAHPFSLGTWNLIFDDGEDLSDTEGEDARRGKRRWWAFPQVECGASAWVFFVRNADLGDPTSFANCFHLTRHDVGITPQNISCSSIGARKLDSICDT